MQISRQRNAVRKWRFGRTYPLSQGLMDLCTGDLPSGEWQAEVDRENYRYAYASRVVILSDLSLSERHSGAVLPHHRERPGLAGHGFDDTRDGEEQHCDTAHELEENDYEETEKRNQAY